MNSERRVTVVEAERTPEKRKRVVLTGARDVIKRDQKRKR